MIYYFSATGNTKWAATKLANQLEEPLQDIKDTTPAQPSASAPLPQEQSAILGFCFPVHGWRVPKIVRDFIDNSLDTLLKLSPDPYIFVLLTCGDDCGKTMDYFNRLIAPKGLRVHAAFSLLMPESYVGLPFMDVDKKEREREKIETAARDIAQIAETIRSRARNIYNVNEGACSWLKSKLIGGYFHRFLVTDNRFKVEADRCTGCGRCTKVCPVSNLLLNDSQLPEWQHNGDCMTCLACYHYCPSHAIVFNSQTRKKGQYHFPKNYSGNI